MPWLVVADTNVNPLGSRSSSSTPVAVSGPLFMSVTVNVTWSPTFGVALLTVLVNARSARRGVTVAEALLLPVLGSNWSAAETVAVLVRGRPDTTVAVSVSVADAGAVSVPTSQRPVVESYVPWSGFAVPKVRPAGRRSVTWTPVASSGPLLVSITVNVTWSPTFGV